MRILTIVRDLGVRGTQRAAINFTLAYKRAGHDVAVLAHRGDGPRRRMLERHEVPVFVGGAELEQALGVADRFEPEVVHIHRRGSYNRRETDILRRLRNRSSVALETNVFGRVDYSRDAALVDVHMPVSAFCLWHWRRWLGRKRSDQLGVLVPNPVEVAQFSRCSAADRQNQRRAWGIPESSYVCGHVGFKLSRWVLEGFECLAEQDPSAWLVIVGSLNGQERHLNSLLASVRRRVVLMAGTEDDAELCRVYSAFDCLLHAARDGESFGYVLAEALLCGTPVVSVSRPHKDNGHLEVIGHGQGGLIAGHSKCFSAAVIELRRDKDLRSHVLEMGPERIKRQCDADYVAFLALRAAQLALEHRDRRDLRRALELDPHLRTTVEDTAIAAIIRDTFGGPSLSDLAMMHLIASPWVQRLVRIVKHREPVLP